MSQHQPSPFSSENGDSNRLTQRPALLPISTSKFSTNTSRVSRIRACRSETRALLPVTSLGDLQSAASAVHGSSSATIPAVARAARTDSPIRGLISCAQDGADLDRRHVETARVTSGRQTLFQNQLGFMEQSQNTILRSLCAWRLATSAVNAEDNMRMLITSVSRMVIQIVTFDSADSGR